MIDKDEAIRLLRKEVANKGSDHIYEQVIDERYPLGHCVYVDTQRQPSCLVGRAIAGEVPISIMQANNMETPDIFVRAGYLTIDAASVFRMAQQTQDSGFPWGKALEYAEQRYRELGGTE